MKDLVQAIIDGGGNGIMYWEPAWISSPMRDRWGKGSSWENNALFDFEGNALPAINYMNHRYRF
jgi:arabinogalactan endo-1,4-beta-galactosidase